jgi:lipoprotein-anchoring transpeptidase ErfK/SrfK
VAKQPVQRRSAVPSVVVALFSALAITAGALSAVALREAGTAPRGATLGGQSVSGMTAAQLADTARRLAADARVSIAWPDDDDRRCETLTASPADLGITVKAEAAASAVIPATVADRLRAVALPPQVPLTFTVDRAVLDAALAAACPDHGDVAAPVDPSVVWDDAAGEFVVKPGKAGIGVSADQLNALLARLAGDPLAPDLTLTAGPLEPMVSEAAAQQAADKVNSRLGVTLRMVTGGEAVYTFTREQMASWYTFTPNHSTGWMEADIDLTKIGPFMSDVFAPAVATARQDRVIELEPDGEKVLVSEGTAGREAADIESLIGKVFAALNVAQDTDIAFDMVEDPPLTVEEPPAEVVEPDPGQHWIDVNLTEQTATLYEGQNATQTFVISSGKPDTPTVKGTFEVYAKTASSTLSGPGYYYPDVKWQTYFKGNYGFHTAYWHDGFGTPQSHGCVNLREEDAKAVWDWAPIGTLVYVHD